MFELKRTTELIHKYDIPKQTVAIVAGIAAPQVTLYLQGGKVSSTAQTRIVQAVRDIGKLMERFGDIRIDLTSPSFVKLLVEKLPLMGFSILTTTNPTTFFQSRRDGKVQTTPYFLSAGSFNLFVAEAIADEIRFEFPNVCVLDNAYKPASHAWVGDARLSPEYQEVMGVENETD